MWAATAEWQSVLGRRHLVRLPAEDLPARSGIAQDLPIHILLFIHTVIYVMYFLNIRRREIGVAIPGRLGFQEGG